MMDNINLFTNASRFSKVTQNSKAIAIFLSIASHKTRNYEQLIGDTNLDLADVAPIVRELEESMFIERNIAIAFEFCVTLENLLAFVNKLMLSIIYLFFLI